MNTTIVKEDNKMGDKDLREVQYYNYHKKGYYANKYPNKEPKN